MRDGHPGPTCLFVAPHKTALPGGSGYPTYGYRVDTILVHNWAMLNDREIDWFRHGVWCRLAPGGQIVFTADGMDAPIVVKT